MLRPLSQVICESPLGRGLLRDDMLELFECDLIRPFSFVDFLNHVPKNLDFFFLGFEALLKLGRPTLISRRRPKVKLLMQTCAL